MPIKKQGHEFALYSHYDRKKRIDKICFFYAFFFEKTIVYIDLWSIGYYFRYPGQNLKLTGISFNPIAFNFS